MNEPGGKSVPIDHQFPSGLVTRFSNHITIQHSLEGEFHISFFEIVPPIVLADSEEGRQKQIEAIEKVQANCVGRIVLTPERMATFVAALAENLRKFMASRDDAAKAASPTEGISKNAG